MRVALVLALALAARTVSATPPEPTGKHPRILLDDELRAAWKAQVKAGHGPVIGAIALCDEARTSTEHDNAQYQGSDWAKTLQACLVAWAATDKLEYESMSLRFFRALLDDLQQVGDGKGGDKSTQRDDGYAIRNLGPYTALAYDWLHDAPGMTPQLRQHARERWAAWLDWWDDKGYRHRGPATNYEAGYLLASTMIAIAQGGEASEQAGPKRWAYLVDELWGKDMSSVLASGGLLDGGDWPEGWQYGPLAVAEYALAARAIAQQGVTVDGISPWLSSMLRRHVYGLTPKDGVWAGGDADVESAYLTPNALTLDAIALGDTTRDDKKWAKGELSRLKITDKDFLLYDSLATVGDAPVLAPRSTWPTWYRTTATGTLFARTRWDDRAVWFVAECSHTLDVDHRQPNAGNFALSRGHDDLIVDPSPYGSQSTFTGNAPTVTSSQFPAEYIPSQGYWSDNTRWEWATQTHGGVVAARCDYTDAYKFQSRKSDVTEALRDFVLLPSADGVDATLVVIDHADVDDAARKMYVRFRVPGELALDNDTATATIGGTRLAIHGATTPTLGKEHDKDCFKAGTVRGLCDAARIPVTDYRVELAGPSPRAVHVVDATDPKTPGASSPITGDGWTGVHVTSPREAVVVWPAKPSRGDFTYRAPKRKAVTHVVLDGPGRDGTANVAAHAEGDMCVVTVAAGGTFSSQPTIVVIDDACAVVADPEAPSATSAVGTRPSPVRGNSGGTRRSGCCGAQSAPDSPIAMVGVVCVVLLRRRRRG